MQQIEQDATAVRDSRWGSALYNSIPTTHGRDKAWPETRAQTPLPIFAPFSSRNEKCMHLTNYAAALSAQHPFRTYSVCTELKVYREQSQSLTEHQEPVRKVSGECFQCLKSPLQGSGRLSKVNKNSENFQQNDGEDDGAGSKRSLRSGLWTSFSVIVCSVWDPKFYMRTEQFKLDIQRYTELMIRGGYQRSFAQAMYSIYHLLWPGGSCRTLARHLERRRRWETIWNYKKSHEGPRCGHCRVALVKVGKERRKLWLKLMGPKPWKLCISWRSWSFVQFCTIFYIIFVHNICTRVHCEVHCGVCAGSFPSFSSIFHKEWRLQRLRQFDKGFLLWPRALAQHVYTPIAYNSIPQHPTAK